MHGLVDITTVVMENEQIKKKTSDNRVKTKSQKKLKVAMVVLIAIIATLLISIFIRNSYAVREDIIQYDKNDIVVKKNEDEKIANFVEEYFQAKVNLNYPKIFKMHGRDYYADERNDKDGVFKQTVDRLKYEKYFVDSYDDIEIYSCKGLRDDEIVLIVTYELGLGFTESKAPMVLLFYLEKVDDTYKIKDSLDVGTSKYIVDVSNTEEVKKIYNDVTNELLLATERSESLRLVYNSLRQFEVNQNVDLDSLYNNRDIANRIGKLDPIKDMAKIEEIIVASENKKIADKNVEAFLKRTVASISEIDE